MKYLVIFIKLLLFGLYIANSSTYAQTPVNTPRTMAIVTTEFIGDDMDAIIANEIVELIEYTFFDHPTDPVNNTFISWSNGHISYNKDKNGDGSIDYLGHFIIDTPVAEVERPDRAAISNAYDQLGAELIDSYDQVIYVISSNAPGQWLARARGIFPRSKIDNTAAKLIVKFNQNLSALWENLTIRGTIVHEMLHNLGLHHPDGANDQIAFEADNTNFQSFDMFADKLDVLGTELDTGFLNFPHLYRLDKFHQTALNYIQHDYTVSDNTYLIPELTDYTDGDVRGIVIPSGKADNYFDYIAERPNVPAAEQVAEYYDQVYDYTVSYSAQEGDDYVYIHKTAAGYSFLLEKLNINESYNDSRNHIKIHFVGMTGDKANINIEISDINTDCFMRAFAFFLREKPIISSSVSQGFSGINLEYTLKNNDSQRSDCDETNTHYVLAKLFNKDDQLVSERTFQHIIGFEETLTAQQFFPLFVGENEISPSNFGDRYYFEVQVYRIPSIANGIYQEYFLSGKSTTETLYNPKFVIDSDYNGISNVDDFLTLLSLMNKTPANYIFDTNFDRIININDFLAFNSLFNVDYTNAPIPQFKISGTSTGNRDSGMTLEILCADNEENCTVIGNRNEDNSCSINCPLNSTVTANCTPSNPHRQINRLTFLEGFTSGVESCQLDAGCSINTQVGSDITLKCDIND